MTVAKRIAVSSLALILGFCGLELGQKFSLPGIRGVVSEAEARVGRPLTPVSVAGVARRTTRRVIYTNVRLSTLPAGCVYGPYYGANYYYCGGVYYQPSGNVYIQVNFN